MTKLPGADQRVLSVLRALRAGLYQSDYLEQRGDPAGPHRNKCVIDAAGIKDREARIWGRTCSLQRFSVWLAHIT
jgi:hypothetical protein